MSHEVIWTKLILETFIAEGCLTKEEEIIMRTRCAGWSRVKQADELCLSLSSIDRLIKSCKKKYDAAQRHNCILPPRRHSVKEDIMDGLLPEE